ncbi:MAG: hypothetical protein ACJART_002194 [Maribacter sp.]|jgi:hypothetical protein
MKNSIIESIKTLLVKFIVSEKPTPERKLVLVYVKGKDGLHR